MYSIFINRVTQKYSPSEAQALLLRMGIICNFLCYIRYVVLSINENSFSTSFLKSFGDNLIDHPICRYLQLYRYIHRYTSSYVCRYYYKCTFFSLIPNSIILHIYDFFYIFFAIAHTYHPLDKIMLLSFHLF